jgi:hypothetical protein
VLDVTQDDKPPHTQGDGMPLPPTSTPDRQITTASRQVAEDQMPNSTDLVAVSADSTRPYEQLLLDDAIALS